MFIQPCCPECNCPVDPELDYCPCCGEFYFDKVSLSELTLNYVI